MSAMYRSILISLVALCPVVTAQVTDFDMAAAVDVGTATVQTLDVPATAVSASIPLSLDGEDVTLQLYPFSMRADDFQLLVQETDGTLVEVEPAPPATVRGNVAGYPGSKVAGSIIDGQLHATIMLSKDTALWGVQPASEIDRGAALNEHVVYNSGDSLPMDVSCGTPSIHIEDESASSATPPPPGSQVKVCEIAIDADVEYYNANGSSVTQTENDIENVMNSVENIYESDTDIQYDITTIIVRTSEPDPYSTNSPGSLLGQFDSHWSANHGGIGRDIAHLFTGKNLSGSVIGIANLNVICSFGSGYGLSQAKYTGNFNNRVALVAHELGHNWNAFHCDGQGDCKIMCSGLGGCGGVGSFGSSAINSIINKKNNSACLSNAGPPPLPVLTQVSPTSTDPLSLDEITITGDNMFDVDTVHIGAVSLSGSEFTINNDAKITFNAPVPAALGPQAVTLENESGTSASGTLTYEPVDPPVLSVPGFALTGDNVTWTYGGPAGDDYYLLVAIDNVTFNFQGNNILLNYFLLNAGPIGPVGVGSTSLILPNSASGLTLYSQVVFIDPPQLSGLTSISSTWVIF